MKEIRINGKQCEFGNLENETDDIKMYDYFKKIADSEKAGYDESLETGTLQFDKINDNDKISDKDIIKVLGIEPDSGNLDEMADFIKQCRRLIKKGHKLDNIGFKDDYDIYVNGKIIDKTKDLIVVMEE